jgi:uroporphyrinogen decarboxylase
VFGMERAMITMLTEPELYHAFAIKQKEYLLEYIRLALKAGAAECCDFFWTGDDFASEKTLLLSPADWRRLVKPYLREAFDLAKAAGMRTLFHSCGAVSEVYPDFIEIGVDSHIGVQTSADGMEIGRLARDFGGRIVIFGGVDAQTTLVSGTPEQVRDQVLANIEAFADCGGYVVSNSHHGLPDMPGENIYAMARGARPI